jgi:hypothetical protein
MTTDDTRPLSAEIDWRAEYDKAVETANALWDRHAALVAAAREVVDDVDPNTRWAELIALRAALDGEPR